MLTTQPLRTTINENFEPNDRQEAILNVLKDGRNENQPWGYANPKRLEEHLNTRRQYINRALQGLVDAGWIEKVNRGLYRYVNDPREDHTNPEASVQNSQQYSTK